MSPTFLIGIIILTGFLLGELASTVRLPKVTGYIVAGILLNPSLTGFVPHDFVDSTSIVTNISLSLITFSVGGSLYLPQVRRLGKGIIYITVFEAEVAFLVVIAGFLLLSRYVLSGSSLRFVEIFIPVSLFMGALASPTDPSATLAVTHEYHAKGDVTSTIMGVAAFDDALGIINYSFAVVLATMFALHTSFDVVESIAKPLGVVAASLVVGGAAGVIFNLMNRFFHNISEGLLLVMLVGSLFACFGVSHTLGLDELLSTMTMGAVVVNLNPRRQVIFRILERYTEQLIFVLFFTLSGMHLDFKILLENLPLVLVFIVLRTGGKFGGSVTGAVLAGSSDRIRKYTFGGLLPQGGIVIGLALLIADNPAFAAISPIVLNVVIGATVIHELIGPIVSKTALQRAGEIPATVTARPPTAKSD
ncbi:MAG TPA: cation:proton antiporter [Spirochaetia bacterium]|nr:cation:proton antiporter [Spirochaetia bacterium]